MQLARLGLVLELIERIDAPCETWAAAADDGRRRLVIAPPGGPRRDRVRAWASSLGLLKRPGVEVIEGVTELAGRTAWVTREPSGRRLDRLLAASEDGAEVPAWPGIELLARMHELVSLVELLHRRHSVGELTPARLTVRPEGVLELSGILAGRVAGDGCSELEEEAARRAEARSLARTLAALVRVGSDGSDELAGRLAARLDELAAEPELSAGRLLSELGALRPRPASPGPAPAPAGGPPRSGSRHVREGILARRQSGADEREEPPEPAAGFGPPRSRRERPSRPPAMSIMAGAPGIVLNRPMRERPDFVPPELIAERRREMAERLRREAPVEVEIGPGHALELRDDLALMAATAWLIPFALAAPPAGPATVPIAVMVLLGGIKACELLPRPPAVLAFTLISGGVAAVALGGSGALFLLAFFSSCVAAIRAGMMQECLEIRAGRDEHRERHADRRGSRMEDSLDRARLFLSSSLAMGVAHLPAALALVEPSDVVGNLFQAMIFAGLGAAIGHRRPAGSEAERASSISRTVGAGGLLAALTFLSRPELLIITALLSVVAAMVIKTGLDEELFGEAAGLGTHDDDPRDFERIWGPTASIYRDSPLRQDLSVSPSASGDLSAPPESGGGRTGTAQGPARAREKG